jgi:KUP system potassium uptake protein
MTQNHHHQASANPKGKRLVALMLGAIGVVFGDIGTSPLYTLRECFGTHGFDLTQNHILSVLSLIIWALLIVVTFKYVLFILRADNRGEGGSMALVALAQRLLENRRTLVAAAGLVGAALFYADGVITPAISVLGAVEGLKIIDPALKHWVVPASMLIILGLFLCQFFGTEKIGRYFGPITVLWFAALAAMGLHGVIQNPEVLWAFSPHHAIRLFIEEPVQAYFLLGSVVLAVTGGEALYADMGHFGRKPIARSWLVFVLPCLVLNYLGQGALVLQNPAAIENPFYLLAPSWALYPLLALATAASVIASQAMISGAFSVTQQAIHLGFLPRLTIKHTSAKQMGQIFIPRVNLYLMIGCLLLVATFKSSTHLAAAYGIAVMGTMVIVTSLALVVARVKWQWAWWRVSLAGVVFLGVDVMLFGATLAKFMHGGWLPIVIALGLFTLMMTWYQGRKIVTKRVYDHSETINHFLNHIDWQQAQRVSGNAVYLVRNTNHVPYALSVNFKHNHMLHSQVLLVKIETRDVPHVPEKERLVVSKLEHGFIQVLIVYGFMQQPHVPKALHGLEVYGIHLEAKETSYFLARETIISTKRRGMAPWREKLFAWMSRNAASAHSFFHLPSHRVVEIGSHMEI